VSAEAARVGAEITKARGERTLESVAAEIPMSHQNLSKLEVGRSNLDDPRTRRTLTRLGEILGKDFGLAWLRKRLQQPDQEAKAVEIDFVGLVPAGSSTEGVEQQEKLTVLNSDVAGLRTPRALRVVGNSMLESNIEDGDIIIVEDPATPDDKRTLNNKIVVAVIEWPNDIEYTLKKWKYDDKRGEVTLEPTNPCYKSRTYPADIVNCFGVLRKVFRTVK
jgi:SOS-response transcriptional repressor LexA